MLVKKEKDNNTNSTRTIKDMGLASLKFAKTMFQTYSRAFDFLLVVLFIMTVILVWIPNSHDTFYNCNTDDIVQYYPYVSNFFNRIKAGELSFYDVTLYGGASYFASTYYIPIDLFLLLAFILSNFLTVELAYYITLLLKIMCGAMILFYFFMRKGFKPSVCVIIALIYTQTAVTEVCFVFPVYLGISFYAPLAMLLVDLFLNKKDRIKGYLFIPLFVLNAIIFDFYIAYMLVAFMCVFFVVESSIYSKKFFLFTKEFYINFITYMMLVFIGLALSAFYLMPSALYIMNESSRTSSQMDYLWYYSSSHYNGDGISFRHYYTQFINYFIPNNPFRLCLIEAGDYIREHGTLYMTSGGIIYFAYFFTLRGKENHRLKIWVGIMNIMYLIPIFAMIFSLSTWAYLRWFFIPYLINVYAMAVGMNKTGFVIGERKVLSFIPVLMMLVGFGFLFYTVIKSPDLFIHYRAEGQDGDSSKFFYGILVTELIFIGLYLVLLVLPHTFNFFQKYNKYITGSIPFVIGLEVIFAAIITFCSLGSESYSSTYSNTKNSVDYLKNNLGYDVGDGYRINLSTNQKDDINANIKYGNVNASSFFQSFYNTPLNGYFADIHKQTSTAWTRRSLHGYTILSGAMFNTKYVITQPDITELKLSPELYTLYKDPTNTQYNYYVLKETTPFIVYDDLMFQSSSVIGGDDFLRDVSLLEYGYVKVPDEAFDLELPKNLNKILEAYDETNHTLKNDTKVVELKKDSIRYMDTIKKLCNAGINNRTYYSVYSDLDAKYTNNKFVISSTEYKNGYFYYDLTNSISKYNTVFNSDAIYLSFYNSATNGMVDFHAYLRDPYDKSLRPFHYNMFYNDAYNMMPTELVIRGETAFSSSTVNVYGFDYDIYNSFIERQKQYQNKEFRLDGSNMHIKFDVENADSSRVIKTAYAYSSDWIINNNESGYETIDIDGGFLGIIVPKGINNVDINLYYSPAGYKTGFKISAIGLILYIFVSEGIILYEINKRRKRGIFR